MTPDTCLAPKVPGTMLAALLVASLLAGCTRDTGQTDNAAAPPARTPGAALVPADRDARVALGLQHPSAMALFESFRAATGGGAPLDLDDMPDWTGLWQRVGPPLFDPEQKPGELTTAKLKPEPMADLERRRELSKQGIEYDPLSNCSPPGFPRWLAIPFLREFIVSPTQTLLFSETMNNMRRVYTDGRGHPPAEDAYPLHYGDSIGFWADKTLVIHTSQVMAGIFHRNDPVYSDALEAVEVWNKTAPDTVTADVWIYDPETLLEPWYVRQTYKQVPNPDGYLRIGYWACGENPNNTVVETDEGTSQFKDFTFTTKDDGK